MKCSRLSDSWDRDLYKCKGPLHYLCLGAVVKGDVTGTNVATDKLRRTQACISALFVGPTTAVGAHAKAIPVCQFIASGNVAVGWGSVFLFCLFHC